MNFEQLIRDWSRNYYTDLLSVLTAVVCFFLIRRRQTASIFLYYMAAYILLFLTLYVHRLFFVKSSPLGNMMNTVELYVDHLFTLLEFIIFFFFFKKTLKLSFHKKILTTIFWAFISISLVALALGYYRYNALQINTNIFLFNIQAICLLIPCVLYFVEVFTSSPNRRLSKEFGFWIVMGLSVFMISTFPYSLFMNYFVENNQNLSRYLGAIFYIFYTLLFITITKAHSYKELREINQSRLVNGVKITLQ